ncbi:hypothetical protein MKX03_009184 [Papaver bracteatum]|nr:hypothetical protein MKX03_009184 [Papaver bracteatum]
MAEAVVSVVIQRLSDFLIQEVVFLNGVKDQVEWLRNELQWMQGFLKDADLKQDENEMIRNWVFEIRDITYDAEDIIDTFILQIEEEKKTPPKKGFMVVFNKYAGVGNKGKNLHNIGRKIKGIKKRLSDLSIKRDIYEIRYLGELTGGGDSISARERLRHVRRSSPHADGEDFIGLNDDVEELVKLMTGQQLRRCVILIVGMGGIGKTILAKKVYNHSKVQFLS